MISRARRNPATCVCAQSEGSDQPVHLSSLCTQQVTKDPSFLHADSEDYDQTELKPRLI